MIKNLISTQDFSKEEILHILDVAKEFEANREQNFLAGKVIACLFFEPSTRTRLSFERLSTDLGPGSSASRTTGTPARPRAKHLRTP
jgi:Aspartate carbamoyltransferase, catalytic chain